MSWITFPTIEAAIRAGFVLYDRTAEADIVRKKNEAGLWMLAIVPVRRD